MDENIKKLYYSISEVCEMLDLKQYVLRYWETEFDVLKPLKNRSGNRIYTEEDIANVRQIKKLLYEDKFTIEGAKNKLSGPIPAEKQNNEPAVNLISEIRGEIQGILADLS